MAQAPDRPSNGTVFGVVMGFVAGVLVTALALPDHGSRSVGLSATGANPAVTAPVTDPAASAQDHGTTAAADPAGVAPGPTAGEVAGGSVGLAPQPGVTSIRGAIGGVRSSGPTTGATRSGVRPAARPASGTTKTGTTKSGTAAPAGAFATLSGPIGNTRGVTDTAIKIGIAYPDLTALKTLGSEYDNGDVPLQWKAWHDGLVQRGVLPINGRDITFAFAKYNVVDTNDQNTACRSLVEDNQVFAVIGVAYFEVGSSCVAQTEQTPLLTPDGPSDSAFAASAPYLFSLSASDSRILRNQVYWADQRGALKGKRIGVYYANDPVSSREAETQVIGTLKKLGYAVTASDSTGQTLGGPEDGIAVQKFSSAKVDLVILLTSKGGFMQQADAQGYKPTYIESDHSFGTSDVTTSNYPAAQFDGTYAMTGRTTGEIPAGQPVSPEADACIKNYEKQTGQTLARPGPSGHQSAVYGYNLYACDLGKVLLTALAKTGRGVGQSALVRGLKTIDNLSLTAYPSISFTNSNAGGSQQRTLRWTRDCTCWKAQGSFAPFPSP
jgi:hypothetical protein